MSGSAWLLVSQWTLTVILFSMIFEARRTIRRLNETELSMEARSLHLSAELNEWIARNRGQGKE